MYLVLLLKREVGVNPTLSRNCKLESIDVSPLFLSVLKMGRDQCAMKISQETCLFNLKHQFLRRIGGVIARI